MGSSAILMIRLRQLMASGALLLVLVLLGYGVTHGYATYLIALAAMVVVATIALAQRGLFVGLMCVAAMDGIPFIYTQKPFFSHVSGQDLAIILLLLGAVAWLILDRTATPRKRVVGVVGLCGLALFAWFAFTVIRTSGNGSAPFLSALNYGRDFGFFALLLMILPRMRLSDRDLKILVSVLGVAVCLFSVGQILSALGYGAPSWLVHETGHSSATTYGLTRVYAAMNDMILVGLVAAVGAILLAPTGRFRRVAVAVAILLTFSFVIQLSRARWIGLVLALLVVTIRVLVSRDSRFTSVLKRRLGGFVAGLSTAGFISVLTAPHTVLSGPFAQRLASIFTDIGSSQSTVAYRTRVISALSALLAGKWLIGVGLIPPSAHYFTTLPVGSLRNVDVGVMNVIAPMGLIGAALIYLPVLVVLIHVLRRQAWSGMHPWLRYSVAIWIVATIASSGSINTLMSVSGLTMTAVILTIAVHPSVSGTDERDDGTRPALDSTES